MNVDVDHPQHLVEHGEEVTNEVIIYIVEVVVYDNVLALQMP